MKVFIRKFYYGDIPEEKGGGNSYQAKQDSAMTGHCGKYLSAANRALIINMQAAFMLPMHKWPLKMQEMFIQEEWKE